MLLSLAIWVPIAAGLLVLACGGDEKAPLARTIALAGAIFGFLVTIPLYAGSSSSGWTGSRASTSATTWAWTASRCCSFS